MSLIIRLSVGSVEIWIKTLLSVYLMKAGYPKRKINPMNKTKTKTILHARIEPEFIVCVAGVWASHILTKYCVSDPCN